MKNAIVCAVVVAMMPSLVADDRFFSEPSLRVIAMGHAVTVKGNSPAAFTEWRDVPQGLTVPLLYASSGTGLRFFRVAGTDIGQRDASVSAAIGTLGRWRAAADFDQWPHLLSTETRSLHTYLGNGRVVVSPGIRGAVEAAEPDITNTVLRLIQDASPRRVATQRDSDRLRFEARISDRWSVRVRGRDEMRNGLRPYSVGAFDVVDGRYAINGFEFSAPVEIRTNDVGAGASFRTARFGLDADATYSRFRNSVTDILFDNPFRITDQAAPTSLRSVLGITTDWPDANMIAAIVSGYFDLGDRARMASSLMWSKWRQAQHFAPYTLNFALSAPGFPPGLSPVNLEVLPQASLQGRVITLSTDDSLSYRIAPAAIMQVRYRDHDAGDITRPILFPGYAGAGDSQWRTDFRGGPIESQPVAVRERSTSADLSWRPLKAVQVRADVEHQELRRGGRSGGSATENIVGGRIALRIREGSSGSLSVRWSDRGSDAAADDVLRRIDLLDRRRQNETAQWEWSPKRYHAFGVSASLSQTDDHFSGGVGLQRFRVRNGTVDGRWDLTAHGSAGVNLSRENVDSAQEWFEVGAAAPREWRRQTADDLTSVGLSWSESLRDDRLSIAARGLISFADQLIAHRTTAGRVDWPVVSNRLQTYSFDAQYAWSDRLHMGVRYLFDLYGVNDLAWGHLSPYPAPLLGSDTDARRLLFLDTQSTNHNAYMFALYVRMALGSTPR